MSLVKDHRYTERALEPGPVPLHVTFRGRNRSFIVASPESIGLVADLINRYPDRFLFGTDEVAPVTQAAYLKIHSQYAPLLARLTPEASEKLRKKNYERLFDEARRRVRAWERANVKETGR